MIFPREKNTFMVSSQRSICELPGRCLAMARFICAGNLFGEIFCSVADFFQTRAFSNRDSGVRRMVNITMGRKTIMCL